MHTYIHTYVRTYIHTYVHTYIHTERERANRNELDGLWLIDNFDIFDR